MRSDNRAAKIREFVRREYIEPAIRRGEATIEILVGDIHRRMHLQNLAPNVCQALSGRKFLQENHLILEKRDGPPSGLGTTVKFVYRVACPPDVPIRKESPLIGLRGIARDIFRDLGGGEAFIRKEREQFYGSGPDR
jgi:hypothetical protein